jgi:hygromycin-B 7''-O-kinase
MSAFEQPDMASRSNYARLFQDAGFWQPYVDEVLRWHNLPPGQATLCVGGTFPTFLVGEYVVKFFGQLFDGAECFEIEQYLHSRVLSKLGVSVPRHVADGHLFESGWRWPYIVTSRLNGTAWPEMSHRSVKWQPVVAGELGAALRQVHELECPDESI